MLVVILLACSDMCAAALPQAVLDGITSSTLRSCVQTAAIDNGWNTATDVDSINCQGLGISTAAGLEQFTSLSYLNLRSNVLSSIDVSALTALETLYLDHNQLTTISVDSNTALLYLSVSDNQLSAIDVSGNPALWSLNVSNNQFAGIDISQNPLLYTVSLDGNQFTSVSLANNAELVLLGLARNQFSTIDVSSNLKLRSLRANDNLLTNVDLSQNGQLTWVHLQNNQLTGFGPTSYQTLQELNLDNNQISEIDISSNTALKTLRIKNNPLSQAAIDHLMDSHGDGLAVYFDLAGGLPQSVLDAITHEPLATCAQISALRNGWAFASDVLSVTCNGLDVRDIGGLQQFTGLTYLELSDNFYLTSIDVSVFTALTELILNDNRLGSIDVSSNVVLDLLYLAGNQLSVLNVSSNPLLTSLWVGENSLTQIDLSSNPNLYLLDLGWNQLTSIDLSGKSSLRLLGLNDNQISALSIADNGNLGSVDLDNNQLTTIDISNNPSIYTLKLRGNPLDRNVHAYLESINGQNGIAIYLDPLDWDGDGIADYIDPNPDIVDPVTTQIGADYTLTILGSGRVASFESPNFSYLDFRDTAIVAQITNRIYDHFRDDFDFIVISDNYPNANGFFVPGTNEVSGIGLGMFDNSSSWGSAGTLQGVIHLTSRDSLTFGPSLHEIGHRWMNSLSSVPDANDASHWGYSNVGGLLGGWEPNTLESLGGGKYRARGPTGAYGGWNTFGGVNNQPYGELELYLMGLIGPDEVNQDIKIANDFGWFDQAVGVFTASSITTVTMEQLVATDGSRLPTSDSSQKDFRVLHLILTDTPLTVQEWRKLDQDVYNFGLNGVDGTPYYNFWEATGGRATLTNDGLVQSLLTSPLVDTDGDGIPDVDDLDDDADGLPDDFEIANGLDPLDAADASLDPDIDGLSNLEEYIAGSDPNDSDSDDDGLLDGEDSEPLIAFLWPELLMRRSIDNRWFSYVVSFSINSDVVIENRGFASLTRNPAFQVVSRSDFNGDGHGDVLVRDMVGTENGRWVMYTLDGPQVLSSGFVDLTRNADWQVTASDDYDGDGQADLLMRNTDGRWLMYLLDAHTVKSQGVLAMSTDLTDTLVGTGDFDNDGRHDVLLRRADGSWLMYQLDGLTAPVESTPAMTSNLAFAVESLADFNGDGTADVLLRRDDGRWFMYELNGSTINNSGSPAMSENTDFSLMSDSDFNGDGTADALLRRADGRWFLYTLNGVSVVNEGNIDMTRNPLFDVVSTDDFNGDGKADALLRRNDGRWVLYGLDGDVPTILGQSVPDMTRNEAWVPQL